MNLLLVIGVPLALLVMGMIWNSNAFAWDEPPSSPEQDPLKRVTVEKES